jgi:exopolysaccharide production protein ExoZ
VPLYWAFTLVAAALALLAPHLFKTTVFDPVALVQSLLFIPFHNAASGGIHPLYKLGWTLNYEVFFYICFALLAFLEAGKRVVWLTLAFSALALVGLAVKPTAAIPQFYTSFMPLAFCAGAWLGLATLRGRIGGLSHKVVFVMVVLGLAGMIEGFAVDRHGLVEDGLAFVGYLVFASALVLLAVRLEQVLPRVRLLEAIGDASYSIYLVHIYEVAVLSGLAFKLLDPANLLADYVVAAVSVAGGTLAGLVVYRLAEQPLLAWISLRWPKRAASPVPAKSSA